MKTLILLAFVILANSRALAQVDSLDPVPSREEFIPVEVEPVPMDDVHRLILYPREAIEQNIEGKVTVSVLINKLGGLDSIVVESSTNALLSQAAIDAFKRLRFFPAKHRDKPIKVWYTQSVVFRLRSED